MQIIEFGIGIIWSLIGDDVCVCVKAEDVYAVRTLDIHIITRVVIIIINNWCFYRHG